MVENATPYELAKAEGKKAAKDAKDAKNAAALETSAQKQASDEAASSAAGDIADSGDNLDTSSDMNFVFDIPLQISAELGQLDMTIRELLSLNIGGLIELEKLAGEPLEMLINGKKVCRGEVIVINEHYGVRMTDLIDPKENTEIKSKTSQG